MLRVIVPDVHMDDVGGKTWGDEVLHVGVRGQLYVVFVALRHLVGHAVSRCLLLDVRAVGSQPVFLGTDWPCELGSAMTLDSFQLLGENRKVGGAPP